MKFVIFKLKFNHEINRKEMEKKYIVVYTYQDTTSKPDTFITNVLSFDEMMNEYMDTLFLEKNPNDWKNISDTELENTITSWENTVRNSRTSPVKIYELDTENFHTTLYSIPLEKMVEHVKTHFKS